MLGNIVKNDPIVSLLLSKSSLTNVQLDTLLIEVHHSKNGFLSTKISARDKTPVSKGSYTRSKSQALANLQKFFYTFILIQYMEIISSDSLSTLFQLAQTIKSTKGQILDSERARMIGILIDQIVTKIVM